MTDELGGIGKVAVVAKPRYYPVICLEVLRNSTTKSVRIRVGPADNAVERSRIG
jgi:hypothetical protein